MPLEQLADFKDLEMLKLKVRRLRISIKKYNKLKANFNSNKDKNTIKLNYKFSNFSKGKLATKRLTKKLRINTNKVKEDFTLNKIN